jgi:hypothetical protein
MERMQVCRCYLRWYIFLPLCSQGTNYTKLSHLLTNRAEFACTGAWRLTVEMFLTTVLYCEERLASCCVQIYFQRQRTVCSQWLGLHSSDGQRLQWQLPANDGTLERIVALRSAVQLSGIIGRVTASWVPGIEHGAWSQLRFRPKKHKYVFCVCRDDERTERRIACL